MAMEMVQGILSSCNTEEPKLPPTILYNEGWVLRLVLEWFSKHRVTGHALDFDSGSRWYSEALLPSAFLATCRGDPLAEGRTHADGVIGHFNVGVTGKGDLELGHGAKQLVIVEAKMFSGLSAGVKNADYYDQAARAAACIAEVLRCAGRAARAMSSAGYCVLAPEKQIEAGSFANYVNPGSIREKVERRVGEWVEKHEDDKTRWYAEWFEPTLQAMRLEVLSWEEVIRAIHGLDVESEEALRAFYDQCVKFNS